MKNNHFQEAFSRTMEHEGGYSDNPQDYGGKTYMGISRVYWPEWEGWKFIDVGDRYNAKPWVEQFYKTNFWLRIQGAKLAAISSEVAYEVFDTAVNLDVPDAVRFLQTALNMQKKATRALSELKVDGLLGPKTLMDLKIYLTVQPGSPDRNQKILLNCMNGEQYICYKANPQHTYFRGWFLRI